MEKSFVMLKPGVLCRRIAGEVISRFEKKGLKLVGLKLMRISPELAAKHYAEHFGKSFYDNLINYIVSGPVIAMVWEGDDCISLIRKLVGPTSPKDALPGSIRGDYAMHTNLNIVHASDSIESACREVSLFFNQDEILEWDDPVSSWY